MSYRRSLALSLVLLLHLGLLLMLRLALRPADHRPADRNTGTLISTALYSRPGSPAETARPHRMPSPAPVLLNQAELSPTERQPSAAPSLATSVDAQADQTAAALAAASAPAKAALDLRLPGAGPVRPSESSAAAAVRDQALRDPRSNTARLSRDERFAIGIGALPCIYEERQTDGSISRGTGQLAMMASQGTMTDTFGATMQVTNPVPVCVKAR